MHQLAVLSTGWVAFFHSAPDGVHLNPFLFVADHCTFFFWVIGRFSLDLTSHITTLLTCLHSYDILGARMLWKPKEARILKNFIDQPV